MTSEELDEARIMEAKRISFEIKPEPMFSTDRTSDICRHVLQLTREGWMPTDPLMSKAREIAVAEMRKPIDPPEVSPLVSRIGPRRGFTEDNMQAILRGEKDWVIQVRAAYAALKSKHV